MPEPTPTPTPNAGANADATFLAHTQYQSDASLAAAYYAAHPDEAKANGVNLPGQQAAPAPTTGTPPQAAPAPPAPAAGRPSDVLLPQQEQANQAQAAAGQHLANLNTATLGAEVVQKGAGIAGGAAALMAAGIAAPAAIVGGALLDKAQALGAQGTVDLARKIYGNNHPMLDAIAGLVGGFATGGAMFAGLPHAGGVEPSAAPATEAPPETYPQGTVLDAQGQPMTSAPAEPAAAAAQSAVGGEPGPGATPPITEATPPLLQGKPIVDDNVRDDFYQSLLERNKIAKGDPGISSQPGSWSGIPESRGGEQRMLVYRGADGEPVGVAELWKDDADSAFRLENFAVDKSKGLLAGKAAVALGKEAMSLGATTPGSMSSDAAQLMEHAQATAGGGGVPPTAPPPDDFSTPGGAAQTLAEKQLTALKTARVGENVATEFGRPDIATRVPIEQTIAEGQALRHTVEMPAEPGAEQPELAAHTAAHAGVYQDESNAIRAEASRIKAAQEAGQDTTADKEALANRFSAYAVNYSNMAGMRSDVGRSLQILHPLKPENILATETAKLAQTVDPNDVDTLVDKLSKITYASHGDLAEMRAEATRITAGEAAGQDMTADKAALGERWKNSVTRTPAAVAEPDKPSGFAWTDSPGGPLRPAGQWAKQWADKLAADTARLRGELSPDDVDTLTDKLSKLEPEQQAAMARQIGTAAQQGRSVSGMMREYFYNALVSRPTTVVKKIASDLTSWALNSPTRAIAAKIPVWWGSEPRLASGEGNAFAYGSVAAYQDALRVSGNYFRAGGSAIDALGGGTGAEFEMPMAPEIRGSGQGGLMDTGADLLGHAVRMPTRTIGTAHEFARFTNFRGELNALALRQATHESGLQGLAGEEAGNFISQRATELADNPTPDLFQAAHAAANYNTFSQPLGPIGQSISKGLDKLPLGLGRFAAPFRKIPVNLAKWAMNYTPIPAVAGAPGAALYGAARAAGADGTALGGSLNSFYTDMAAGGAPAQLALAKLGMGSTALLAVHQAHLDGILTDGGPSDTKLYHDQLATGWKPYSIHVNGHYYGFQNLEPLGQYLGLGTDFSAIMGHMPEADISHAAIAGAMAIGNNVSRQSYVEMLANFNRLVDGIKRGKGMSDALDEFGESQLSGLIPAALRAEAKREDPVMRDTRGMYNTFLSKIPGYSKTMPPMTDALARPILAPAGFMANEVYPFPVSSDKHDPIADETLRLGASPEKAPQLLPGSGTKTPSMMNPYSKENPNVGIPLTPWDQYNWMKLRASIKDDEGPDGKTMDGKTPTGNTLEQTLTAMLQNPEYQKAPREAQIKHWESAFQIYGHAATVQMNQRPDLKQKLDQRVRYKTEAATPLGVDQDTWLRQNGITPMAAGGDAPL